MFKNVLTIQFHLKKNTTIKNIYILKNQKLCQKYQNTSNTKNPKVQAHETAHILKTDFSSTKDIVLVLRICSLRCWLLLSVREYN